jgi:hypothetical protein
METKKCYKFSNKNNVHLRLGMFWITLLFGTVLSFVLTDRQLRPVFEIRLTKKGSREGHANYAVILVITSESDDAVCTRVSSVVTVSCACHRKTADALNTYQSL